MKCTICRHPRRLEIDADLATDTTGKVAKRYDLSFSALYRHKKKMHHLATGKPEDSHERILRLVKQVEKLVSDSEREGSLESRTSAIRAASPALRLLSQISGDLKALAPAVRIDGRRLEDSPEFRIFLAGLVSILERYPDCKREVLSCIES